MLQLAFSFRICFVSMLCCSCCAGKLRKSVGLQRHHGVVVCGSTVAEAFDSWTTAKPLEMHRIFEGVHLQL